MNFKELRDSTSIFKTAFTHPGFHKNSELPNYQRLEFLGDKVLGFVLAEHLFNNFPDEAEGTLSIMLANLSCTKVLAEIAQNLGFGNLLILDKGDEKNNGRANQHNLEDCMEAVIGAIFLNFGIDTAKNFIIKQWQPLLSQNIKIKEQDPKSKLQEIMHKLGLGTPEYILVDQSGDAHNPIFTYKVDAGGGNMVTCSAASKKLAQKECAKLLIKKLQPER